MLELLQNLVILRWRRSGAAIRDARIGGARVWYAEFPPRVPARTGDGASTAGGDPRPPALLLVHPLGASSITYQQMIPHLRERYRVIAPDLPGMGLSRPPGGREFLRMPEVIDVLESLTERVAPEGAYVAGHCIGGWIAAKLAARRPDLIRGLGLLNPVGPALHAEDWFSGFQRVVDLSRQIDGAGAPHPGSRPFRIRRAEDTVAMDEMVRLMFHRPPVIIRLLRRELCRTMRGPAVVRFLATVRPEDFVSEQEAMQVSCPAILVWGEQDRFVPGDCRTFYLRNLRRVRHEPIAECGHSAPMEQPARAAEILLQLRDMGSGQAHEVSARRSWCRARRGEDPRSRADSRPKSAR